MSEVKEPKKASATKKAAPKKKVEVKAENTKFCQFCGESILETADVCGKCGKFVNEQAKASATGDTTKVYRVLSYLGILWLVGMLSKEKNDKSVKFHVGQGMLVTILAVALQVVASIINNAVIANIFRTEITYWGIKTGVYTVSGFGATLITIINLVVWGIVLTFEIIGITNAVKNRDKKLPVIGKVAFYK